MTIRPVQFNIANTTSFKRKEAYKSYLEAEGAIKTAENVKPLPPKGHLVHDGFGTGLKYFFKDIGYDLKAVKDGIQGNANDHQLGRLNDVGLRLGGIGIAAYLASKTKNPKARLMEYVGLATFLTVMAIYPKLAISGPAKLKHGFDVDKEYIDDQGRKKSVMQDANYIPYDMYRGEYSDEDLEKIGDKLGIPRDIKNRNDVIREQMRKISTQNNTLWMLTAGLATPALTALLCNGLENYVVTPALEKARNNQINKEIADILNKTKNMGTLADSAQASKLSANVEKILRQYQGKELPAEELEKLIKVITSELDSIASSGIEEDVVNIIKTAGGKGKKTFYLDEKAVENMLVQAKASVKENETMQKTVIPTKEELVAIIKKFAPDGDISKGVNLDAEKLLEFKKALSELLDGKIDSLSGLPDRVKLGFKAQKNISIESMSKNIQTRESTLLTEEAIKKVVSFSKIMSEFKENLAILDKCKSFKFEFTEETILARSSAKFEKTVLKELGISYKDLKKMRESSEYTRKILEEKLGEICKDEARYKKFVESIGKVMSDLEVSLHGSSAESSQILDLINAIEHNYNNTVKRLAALDKDAFRTTIKKLINEDAATATTSIKTREQLFNFFDGLQANNNAVGRAYANGKASSKYLTLNRMFSRYQGSKNIYNRFLHTLEIYKQTQDISKIIPELTSSSPEYVEEVIKRVKDTILEASSKKHTLKLDIVTDENLYRDIMNVLFRDVQGTSIKEKGFVTQEAKDALKNYNGIEKGSVLDRFQYYLSRFKNIISNNTTDFTKPNHIFDEGRANQYIKGSRTQSAMYDLIGQSPIEFLKGAAKNQYGTQKWLRIVGAITGSVFATAFLAQFAFGKLNNPQNLQKQVKEHDSSK